MKVGPAFTASAIFLVSAPSWRGGAVWAEAVALPAIVANVSNAISFMIEISLKNAWSLGLLASPE
jgi:hypothetical protein